MNKIWDIYLELKPKKSWLSKGVSEGQTDGQYIWNYRVASLLKLRVFKKAYLISAAALNI